MAAPLPSISLFGDTGARATKILRDFVGRILEVFFQALAYLNSTILFGGGDGRGKYSLERDRATNLRRIERVSRGGTTARDIFDKTKIRLNITRARCRRVAYPTHTRARQIKYYIKNYTRVPVYVIIIQRTVCIRYLGTTVVGQDNFSRLNIKILFLRSRGVIIIFYTYTFRYYYASRAPFTVYMYVCVYVSITTYVYIYLYNYSAYKQYITRPTDCRIVQIVMNRYSSLAIAVYWAKCTPGPVTRVLENIVRVNGRGIVLCTGVVTIGACSSPKFVL